MDAIAKLQELHDLKKNTDLDLETTRSMAGRRALRERAEARGVLAPAADRSAVERLAHLIEAGGVDRALGAVELEAGGVPRQAEGRVSRRAH